MSHSPEPWQIVKHSEGGDMEDVEVLADASGEMLYDACRCHDESYTPSMGLDDLNRIVACINACRGIPTNMLESVAKGEAEMGWRDPKLKDGSA